MLILSHQVQPPFPRFLLPEVERRDLHFPRKKNGRCRSTFDGSVLLRSPKENEINGRLHILPANLLAISGVEFSGRRFASSPVRMAEGSHDFGLLGKIEKRGIATIEFFPREKNFILPAYHVTSFFEGGIRAWGGPAS